MKKKAYFYIDDVIWVFRDLTRKRPESLFDNPFLKALKEAYDKYGVKTQLNVFCRTDYFYGNDEFCLDEMTDAYKKEWESASDWLKLAFHAKQEYPDYPHVNAKYEDVKAIFEYTKREIYRFAGENSFATAITPHWLPVSYEGIRALYDCGVRLCNCSFGNRVEYNGDPASLPYGHALRLLNNRQPETQLFTRKTRDTAIASSICAHNHISEEQNDEIFKNLKTVKDEKTGIHFKRLCNSVILNLTPYEELESDFAPHLENEFVGVGTHEQYFYEDYLSYQPDYSAKILKMGEILSSNGYEFFFAEEIVK